MALRDENVGHQAARGEIDKRQSPSFQVKLIISPQLTRNSVETAMSSSMSGQWMPCPPPISRQFCR